MTLTINETEKSLLLELLKTAHKSLVDEMHHTDGFEYKEMLKQKLENLKELESKVETAASAA